MSLPFKIALRFLKSNIGQTILIIIGISIGVSVQVFIGSLIQGLQKSLLDTTIGSSPHITILSTNDNKLIGDWKEKVNIIEDFSDIKTISVSSDSPSFINFNNKTESVLIRGFLPDKANNIYKIENNIYEGKFPSEEYQVLVGKELSDSLGLFIGDKIEIITPQREMIDFTISGFYDLKIASINRSWIITNLETSQKVFDFGDFVTSIEIQVNEVFDADLIASNIISSLNSSEIDVQNWKDQNQQLLSGLNGQSVSSIMIQVFVMISVLLGIASVLAISVVQRSKQIGILKAMGIKDKSSSMIFIYQGLLLGLAGALVGVFLGLGLSFMFSKFAVNPDGTPVVPLYLDYSFIALSAIIATAASVIAALIPARKTSKLNPIEVIRNG
ncbi:UNVERIFIED_CONTAM: lipoprotein-releasing system permease protein [Acetivibrio alkalicellulosi]